MGGPTTATGPTQERQARVARRAILAGVGAVGDRDEQVSSIWINAPEVVAVAGSMRRLAASHDVTSGVRMYQIASRPLGRKETEK